MFIKMVSHDRRYSRILRFIDSGVSLTSCQLVTEFFPASTPKFMNGLRFIFVNKQIIKKKKN